MLKKCLLFCYLIISTLKSVQNVRNEYVYFMQSANGKTTLISVQYNYVKESKCFSNKKYIRKGAKDYGKSSTKQF